MAGLDKIVNQILADAEQNAADRLETARKEADGILEQARMECRMLEEEAAKKEEEIRSLQESRRQSAAVQQQKTAILRAKQEVIQEVLDEAYEVLKNQEVSAYFDMIEKQIRTYALSEVGEIYFSEKDLGRMPEGFESRLTAAAKECGGRLKLMKESRPITDGFVLVYGGIEENCTLKALIDAKRDQLSDRVNRILFA